MNTIGNSPMGLPIKTAGTIFNAMNKPKTPATPSLNYTPMSTSALQSSIAPKQNNTPEIKGTTLSKPNFNPNANVLNQNLMTNYNQPQNIQAPQQPVDLPQLPQVSTPTPTLPTTPVESEADK